VWHFVHVVDLCAGSYFVVLLSGPAQRSTTWTKRLHNSPTICNYNFIPKLFLRLLWFFRRTAALFRQIRTLHRGLQHGPKGCTIPLQSATTIVVATQRPTTYTKRSLNSVNKAPGIHNTHMKRANHTWKEQKTYEQSHQHTRKEPILLTEPYNIHEKSPTTCEQSP